MAKRILSLFLCLALMIGMVPAFAFSTGATEVAEKAQKALDKQNEKAENTEE